MSLKKRHKGRKHEKLAEIIRESQDIRCYSINTNFRSVDSNIQSAGNRIPRMGSHHCSSYLNHGESLSVNQEKGEEVWQDCDCVVIHNCNFI